MKKKVTEYVKKAVAIVAMAAAVVTVVPRMVEAGTPATTGCTGNTSTGYHNFRFYCGGFETVEKLTHTYYARPIVDRINKNPSTCTYKKAIHSSVEYCSYCGKHTGVKGTHCDNYFHQDCSIGTVDYGYCNELWNDVTVITQY